VGSSLRCQRAASICCLRAVMDAECRGGIDAARLNALETCAAAAASPASQPPSMSYQVSSRSSRGQYDFMLKINFFVIPFFNVNFSFFMFF
jgi:hypothetical protein